MISSTVYASEPNTLSRYNIIKIYINENPRICKSILVVTILSAIYGVYLGITNRYIFYNDKKDILLSLMTWLSVPIVYVLMVFFEFETSTINKTVLIVPIIIFICVIIQSYKHNNKILVAIIISIAKIIISFFVVIQFNRLLTPAGDNRYDKRRDVFWALAMLAITSTLIYKLTNGDNVRGNIVD
jgi:membrane-associated HD superfamily phosphohydrolase